ncbi:GNAT family N-acetyltransferase [Streptomyces sp. NPDC020192]|uniref:GNAT family N-acetyltransferase n=1 Tax=Streptomyces sp. NPDC020192 TaxID=3365066 RepID=UPI00379763E9
MLDAFHQRCSPASLLRRWGRTHLPHPVLGRLLSHTESWLGLGGDGKPIALVSAGPLSREAGVFDLGLQVADTWHRRGIGTLLARHAAEHAHTLGAHTLSAYTEASNEPMLRLLDRLGLVHHIRHGSHLDVRLPLGAGPPRISSLLTLQGTHAPQRPGGEGSDPA